jgi:hypothetical protein
MAIGQKEAVIKDVITLLPNFRKGVDNALLLLSSTQLELLKAAIYGGIFSGAIEYSKDRNNQVEVRAYARSMTMNHLKKAKELNGGHSYTSNPSSGNNATPRTVRVKEKIYPKGVNPDLLPEELREFAKTLV